jgi:hypothetical protein
MSLAPEELRTDLVLTKGHRGQEALGGAVWKLLQVLLADGRGGRMVKLHSSPLPASLAMYNSQELGVGSSHLGGSSFWVFILQLQ